MDQLVARGVKQPKPQDYLFRPHLADEQIYQPLASGRVQGCGIEPCGHGGGSRLDEAFPDAFHPGVEGDKAAFGPGHGPFFLHRFVLVDVGTEIDPDQGEDGQDAKGKEDDEDDGPQSHGMPWLWDIIA